MDDLEQLVEEGKISRELAEAEYLKCPTCGWEQRVQEGSTRIQCRKCGRRYPRRKAKTTQKEPDPEKGLGFFQYTGSDQ